MLRKMGDAFVHVQTRATELGAGALLFAGRFGLAKLAVVLSHTSRCIWRAR
jgi:hypothetical protein